MTLREQLARVISGVQDVDLAVDLVISLVRAADTAERTTRRGEATRCGWEKRRANKMNSDEFKSIHLDSSESISHLRAVVINKQDLDQDIQNPDYCAEPEASKPPGEESPTVLDFPVVGSGSKSWPLTEAHLAEYQAAFSGLDVMGQFREARLWCVNNPGKRKTAKGMARFLQNWLSNAQNRGGGARASPANGKARDPRIGHARIEPGTVYPAGEQEL